MFLHLGSVISDKTVLLLVWERGKEWKKSGSKQKKEDVLLKVRCTFKIFKLFLRRKLGIFRLLHHPLMFTRWLFT